MPLSKLEQTHKDKLVELLLACPCAGSPGSLQSLISVLPDNIRTSIIFRTEDTLRMQTNSILETCLYFEQGLDNLLERVRFFDKDKIPFNEFEKYVQKLKGSSLTQARRKLQPPPLPDKFGGRLEKLADLKKRLMQDSDTLTLTALVGQGGIGKTTLARKAAYELYHKDKQFRAVLWIEVKRTPNAEQLLLNWAKLGNPNFNADGQPVQNFVSEIKASLEDLIVTEGVDNGSDRVLVVFDDVWEAGIPAVKLLKRTLPDRACVLITTRHEKVRIGLGATREKLDRLKTPQAVELLRIYLDDDIPELSNDKLAELAEVLGGHSLALTLAAKRLLEDPYPVAGLIRHIKQYQKSLVEGTSFAQLTLDPDDKDENLELSLFYSYETLSPEEQIRFRALGVLIDDQPFDLKLLAAIWKVEIPDDSERVEEVLEQVREWAKRFCNLSLLEGADETELGDGWYRQHLVLHAYARALLKDDLAEYSDVQNSYQDGTIEIAKQFIELPPEKWKALDPYLLHIFNTGDYLVREYTNWNLEQHYTQFERARNFALSIYHYLEFRPELSRLAWLEMGLTITRQLQEQQWEALFLNQVGLFCSNRGDKRKALDKYEEALPLLRAAGDRAGEASILSNIGEIYRALEEPYKALEKHNEALPIRKEVGDRMGEAITLNNIGGAYRMLQEFDTALKYYEEALSIRREIGDRMGEAKALNNIGEVYRTLGEPHKALEKYNEALLIRKEVRDLAGEATTLNNIGLAYSDLGESHKALEKYNEALPIRRIVGDRSGEAGTSFNIGLIYYAWEQLKQSIEWVEKCIELEEAIQHPHIETARKFLIFLREELSQR